MNKFIFSLVALTLTLPLFAQAYESGSHKIEYSDGSVYDGEWKDGKFEGFGFMTWADGSKYEGVFTDGHFNGKGTYTYADGRKYEGDFVNDSCNGKGQMTWPNGDIAIGSWQGNQLNGFAVMAWKNGDKYEGNFLNGLRSGNGTMTYSDGRVYAGSWAADRWFEGTYKAAGDTNIWSGSIDTTTLKGIGSLNGQKGSYEYDNGVLKLVDEPLKMATAQGTTSEVKSVVGIAFGTDKATALTNLKDRFGANGQVKGGAVVFSNANFAGLTCDQAEFYFMHNSTSKSDEFTSAGFCKAFAVEGLADALEAIKTLRGLYNKKYTDEQLLDNTKDKVRYVYGSADENGTYPIEISCTKQTDANNKSQYIVRIDYFIGNRPGFTNPTDDI